MFHKPKRIFGGHIKVLVVSQVAQACTRIRDEEKGAYETQYWILNLISFENTS